MENLSTGRVTAGLPSLDPSVRFQTQQKEAEQEKKRILHESNDRKRDDAVSPDGNRDRTDKEACVGNPLFSGVIIQRLKELNPSLQFRHHPFMPRFQVFIKERYVCAFEAGYSPEFEVLLFHWEEHVKGYGKDARLEKVKVLDETVRGWVTLLHILIREKLVTKAGAERMFGPVHSMNWQQKTAGY